MSNFESLGKILIFIGVFIIIAGLLVLFWNHIPFLGKLPGDFSFQKGNVRLFFPIVTCLIISAVLTVVINIVIRLINK